MKLFGSNPEKSASVPTTATGSQLGGRTRRLLTETAQIEDELVPTFVRPMLLIILFALISFLVWGAITPIKDQAVATGEIIPFGNVKVVQHFDGGIVAEVYVKERELVSEGQSLFRLDGSHTNAELRQLEVRQVALRLRAERLGAFAEDRKPEFVRFAESYSDLLRDQRGIYDRQIESRDSTLAIYGRQIAQRKQRIEQLHKAQATAEEHVSLTGDLTSMRDDLAARRLVTRTVMLETRRARVTAEGELARLKEEIAVTQQEISEFSSRRADALNQLRRAAMDELGTVRIEATEVAEAIKRATAKAERLLIRAPHRGLIQDLRVRGIGQVIEGGEVLLQIVPDDQPLEAEILILPKDIAYVKVGQDVNLRVSSYDYTQFGYAKGTVSRIAAAGVTDPKSSSAPLAAASVTELKTGDIYFRAWITLNQPYLGEDPERYPLRPGMSIAADIVTGEKTVLTYLLRPLVLAFSRSFHER
jgi:adhesin transport system membrane fusion protein